MLKTKLFVMTMAVMFLFTAGAVANETTGALGLGVRGGGYFIGGEWNVNLFGGAELNVGLHKNFALGLLGTYGRTDGAGLDLTSEDLPQLIEYDDSLKITHYIIELAGTYYISPETAWRPYLTAGAGVTFWRVDDQDGNTVQVPDLNDQPFDYEDQQLTVMFGAGMEYFLSDHFSIGAATRYHLFTEVLSDFTDERDIGGSDGLDNPVGFFEFGLTLTGYLSSCDDDDDDGVCNEDDRCPETPAGCIIDEETGCELDGDGDGVCDGLDMCSDTPAGCKVDAAGCPLDSDNDGVCDGLDRCDNTPEDCEVDEYGCPLDADGDGVWDCRDNCPDTPEGCKVDESGCPLDGDADGVCDGLDQCPGTPEGLEIDDVGCPVSYEIQKELVLVGVTFLVNQATIKPESKKELDKVVESLKALPHVKLEVAGHTDISGSYDNNVELSQRRAEAVRDYFIEQGIDPERLIAKGYGPDKPKYDNSTLEGRRKNRRVELIRLD
ncbi:MAG TPA: OmpA family protein [candidate division Zixibacteria bacterium]|nr:OmpA family protein [candidate division Zixibacteria bacterium]